MPAPFLNQDIGAPAIAGAATYNNGTFTISGAGNDIWGTSDQFQFVYQPITGDMDVSVHVASLVATDPWAKAGVMMRESLTAPAVNVYSLISAQSGFSSQNRPTTSATSTFVSAGAGNAPTWVRLVRTGSRFDSYRSADGVTWTLMATNTLTLPSTIYVGMAVTSHNVSAATTAVLDNFAITIPTAPANQPPTVSLTAPTAGQSFVAPATITVSANASDPENRLNRVEFRANGTLIGSDTTAPFSVSWASVAAGSYAITATAFDNDGGQATSGTVNITVSANQPPTVSLTSPVAGASFTAPASVNLAASANDPEGRLARVEFYVNGALVGTDTSSPYTLTWSLAAGNYAITAAAFDAEGNRGDSAPVSITVSTVVTIQPSSVSFTASADHATNVTGYRLNIYAATADTTTATPLASSDLGKPTPDASNIITVDQTTFINGLAAGTYQATVAAVNQFGQAQSAPTTFTR